MEIREGKEERWRRERRCGKGKEMEGREGRRREGIEEGGGGGGGGGARTEREGTSMVKFYTPCLASFPGLQPDFIS